MTADVTDLAPDEPPKPDDLSIVIPFTDVLLLDKRHVVMRPWTIAKGAVLLPRIRALLERVQHEKAKTADEWLEIAYQECYALVRDTIEWDDEKMNSLYMEDLVTLTQALIDTCLVRPDGGGVYAKMQGLLVSTVRALATLMPQLKLDSSAVSAPVTDEPSQPNQSGPNRKQRRAEESQRRSTS